MPTSRKVNKNSNWYKLKQFINSKEVGETFTKNDIKQQNITSGSFYHYTRELKYINIIKTIQRDNYEILQKIPEGLNTVHLYTIRNWIIAYNPWKQWFLSIEDLLKESKKWWEVDFNFKNQDMEH